MEQLEGWTVCEIGWSKRALKLGTEAAVERLESCQSIAKIRKLGGLDQ